MSQNPLYSFHMAKKKQTKRKNVLNKILFHLNTLKILIQNKFLKSLSQ